MCVHANVSQSPLHKSLAILGRKVLNPNLSLTLPSVHTTLRASTLISSHQVIVPVVPFIINRFYRKSARKQQNTPEFPNWQKHTHTERTASYAQTIKHPCTTMTMKNRTQYCGHALPIGSHAHSNNLHAWLKQKCLSDEKKILLKNENVQISRWII